MREFSKEYTVTLPDGGRLEVKISANLSNTNENTETILSEFALCSRNFYLDFGRKLMNDSHKEERMDEFKEVFTRVVVSYAEYVEQTVKKAKEQPERSNNVGNYKLIDEVRLLNVIGTTLARFRAAANEQPPDHLARSHSERSVGGSIEPQSISHSVQPVEKV